MRVLSVVFERAQPGDRRADRGHVFKLAQQKQRQYDVVRAPVAERMSTFAVGKHTLVQQEQSKTVGEPDFYTRAVESAMREIDAVRSTSLPAYVSVRRKKDIAPLTKQIALARAAMQVRHMILSANAHVFALEKAATYDNPMVMWLRTKLDLIVTRASKLGVYDGALDMKPQPFIEEKPKQKGSAQKVSKKTDHKVAVHESSVTPTGPAKVTKPANTRPAAASRTRLATGTRAPTPARYSRPTAATRTVVQRKATSAASRTNVHAVAARGVEGASSALPFASVIQRAFGRHDVSRVRVQIGGAAAKASQKLGAKAYATGDLIAFATAPDLHTAAHEAAHVIQQRRGVSLAGGVDDGPSDTYERHADEIADAVVAGKSVEHMFDDLGSRTPVHAIQRKADGSGTAKPLQGFALYLSVHEVAVRQALQTAFADRVWPDPATDLTWQPGGERAFARQLAISISSKIGDANAVRQLVYPGNVQDAINVVGDSGVWEPEFGERLAYTLKIAAAMALTDRMGPRYRTIVASQAQLPTADDLQPARAMDKLVARGLTQPGVVDVGNIVAITKGTAPQPHGASKGRNAPKQAVPSRAQLLDVERNIVRQLDLIRAQALRVGLVDKLAPAYATLSARVVELADSETNEALRAKYAPEIQFQHTQLLTLQPRIAPLVNQLQPLLDGKLMFSATKRVRRDQLMRAVEQYIQAAAFSSSRAKSTAILDRISEREKFEKQQSLANEVASTHSATRGAKGSEEPIKTHNARNATTEREGNRMTLEVSSPETAHAEQQIEQGSRPR